MSSYFDEHNCEPLGQGERPNHFLHFTRMLLESGWGVELEAEFGHLFESGKVAPPAAKKVVEELETFPAAETSKGQQCPVCLLEFELEVSCVKMACNHHFHSTCIIPWLEKTNSCPVCRFEVETDDVDYEEWKKQKKRKENRELELETLHNSMFS